MAKQKQSAKDIDPTNVSSMYLAEVLGVTRDAVSKLYAAKVIKQNGIARGKYNLSDAVTAYSKYLRDNKGSDVATKLKLAQTRKLEIQNDKSAIELIDIQQAKAAFGHAAFLWRCGAAALPKRVAPYIAKTTSVRKIREVLKQELDGLFPPFEKAINGFIHRKSA